MAEHIRWGVLLEGSPEDLLAWELVLPAPHEPYIDRVAQGLVLRSTTLSKLESAEQVRARAAALLNQLYGAISLSQQIGKLQEGTVLELLADGSLREHQFMPVESAALRLRGGHVTVRTYDKDGNIVPPPPPQPSEPQTLLQAARSDERLEKALHHYARADNWFDIYMAVEALFKVKASIRLLPKTLRKRRDVNLLMETANTYRHAYADRIPSSPMAMGTALELLRTLIRLAAEEVGRRQS